MCIITLFHFLKYILCIYKPRRPVSNCCLCMLASAEMRLFLVILQVCRSFRLVAEYSSWSGPVTWISVGSRRQQLKVSVDFQTTKTGLWSPRDCPAFIDGGCFEGSKSSSLEFASDGVFDLDDTCTDRIEFNSEFSVDRFLFNILYQSPREKTRRGSDVSGIMAFGSRADWLQGRVLHLREDDSLLYIQQVDDESASTGNLAVKSGDQWSLRVRLLGKLEPTICLFDLSAEGLVIPEPSTIPTLPNSSIDTSGKMWIPCHQIGDDILVEFHAITLSSRDLVDASVEPNGDMCPLLVRFDSRVSKPRIGRFLLRFVDSVVLNYGRNTIGIVPKDSVPRTVDPSPVARGRKLLPPVFGLPDISEDRIRFPFTDVTDESAAFLLRSERPSPDDDGALCWRFNRLFADPNIGEWGQNIEIYGVYAGLDLVVDSDSLLFNLDKRGDVFNVHVFMDVSRFEIRVCKRQSPTYEYPLLPDPIPRDENAEPVECHVCLKIMQPLEIVQGILGCPHIFHKECIMMWLGGKGSSCPVCRNEVIKHVRLSVMTPTTDEPCSGNLCIVS